MTVRAKLRAVESGRTRERGKNRRRVTPQGRRGSVLMRLAHARPSPTSMNLHQRENKGPAWRSYVASAERTPLPKVEGELAQSAVCERSSPSGG